MAMSPEQSVCLGLRQVNVGKLAMVAVEENICSKQVSGVDVWVSDEIERDRFKDKGREVAGVFQDGEPGVVGQWIGWQGAQPCKVFGVEWGHGAPSRSEIGPGVLAYIALNPKLARLSKVVRGQLTLPKQDIVFTYM